MEEGFSYNSEQYWIDDGKHNQGIISRNDIFGKTVNVRGIAFLKVLTLNDTRYNLYGLMCFRVQPATVLYATVQ